MRTIPPGEWILQGNWDHTLWGGSPLPDHTWIDNVTRENPVWVCRYDGRIFCTLDCIVVLVTGRIRNFCAAKPADMCLANQLAMDLAGVTAGSLRVLSLSLSLARCALALLSTYFVLLLVRAFCPSASLLSS